MVRVFIVSWAGGGGKRWEVAGGGTARCPRASGEVGVRLLIEIGCVPADGADGSGLGGLGGLGGQRGL